MILIDLVVVIVFAATYCQAVCCIVAYNVKRWALTVTSNHHHQFSTEQQRSRGRSLCKNFRSPSYCSTSTSTATIFLLLIVQYHFAFAEIVVPCYCTRSAREAVDEWVKVKHKKCIFFRFADNCVCVCCWDSAAAVAWQLQSTIIISSFIHLSHI